MISQKDITILTHLRKNARKKITEISRDMQIPATTAYDRLKSSERKGVIKKHTSIIDFSKLGFNTTALIAIKSERQTRKNLQLYLENHPSINSLYRIISNYDFLAEAVFEDPSKLQDFIEELQSKFTISEHTVFNITHEIKKEDFSFR